VLKCTVPGVPDFYQGSETWDLRLVDPDNRHPVDYDFLREMRRTIDDANPVELFANWRDGRIKPFLIQKLLGFRSSHRTVFESGDYSPMSATGPHASSCVACSRTVGSSALVVSVARLTARLGFPPIGGCWGETRISIPGALPRLFTDIFTGKEFSVDGSLLLADAFSVLPVAVLWSTAR
jgi:(1->4)-alpha-D-glucan 1-alpha-D-glucosylmutase